MVPINTLAHIDVALIVDRGVKKVRVNLFKDGKITGFLKPVESFSGSPRNGNREGPDFI